MREPNEGIYRNCCECNKRFWCVDGDYTCNTCDEREDDE